jgi:parvulin-like peptidyl-prolyl isomerase
VESSRRPWRRRLGILLAVTSTIAIAITLRAWIGSDTATAQTSGQARRTAANGQTRPVRAENVPPPVNDQAPVAIVNGQEVSRKLLVDACVQRFGEEVLESMVSKQLIGHHCANRGIEVTTTEVDAEIDRMAKRFKLGRQQWLELLQSERGITPQQYASEIIWPTVALRKLAASQLTVTQEELNRAYQSGYGPSVRARLIVVSDPQLAQQVHAKAQANPDDFPRLAMEHSEDVNSASIGGMIQPIRLHVGDPAIEKEVFALKAGQVSSIVRVGNQHAILKCDAHVPARNVPLAQVQDELVESIKEEKLREKANELFASLQESATIKNVYNDPTMQKAMPGVVALVNGEPISYRQLGEECFVRHAEEVLQIEISQLLLRQELARQNVEVTQQDLQAEVVRAAELSGVVNGQGQADLEKWMAMATSDRGVKRDQYMRDSVWPSVALKKLTEGKVQVTDDDLQKAFASNYGEMVRCQAIVLANARRAQEVWEMARKNPTEKAFGDLAAEFSIEPSTKSLRGEVPPIRRHGGREQLENAAFALAPGDLSPIVQLSDKFIILRCLGRTKPLDVQFDSVRQILYQDLYEKKLRLAMSERFEALQSAARIENRLTDKTQAPAAEAVAAPPPREARRDAAVRPTTGQSQRPAAGRR